MNLGEWKGDKLHIDSDVGVIDGHQKTHNFIVTERESGKSTLMWKKVYNAFRREQKRSIIVKRYQADITDSYIEDTEKLINKFTNSQIEFNYTRQELNGGTLDLKIGDQIFCRLIALNTALSRLKSRFLDNVKYMMYDEFICNRRLGEKYLADEPFRIKELYTTYNRESSKGIKIYYFGNPYSLHNPFFSDLNVPTNRLYPGALVADNDYCVWCYQIKDQLKQQILAKNPLYKFDDSYKKYAFDGRAVQDQDIRVIEHQPDQFKLDCIFKIHNKCIGVYRGCLIDGDQRIYYWCKIIDPVTVSRRRDILCFDFGDMSDRTVLYNGKQKFASLKNAIETRSAGFASIEESWMIEEIYQEI